MGLLSWLVVGLVAGWLAGLITRGHGFGIIVNIVIGIIGALLGGWLASAIFGIQDAVSGFNVTTIATALIGAIILVLVLRLFTGRY